MPMSSPVKHGGDASTPREFVPTSFQPGEPLGGILGRTVELTAIDFLLGFPTKEFNVSELARAAEISRPSARSVILKFLEWGLLEEAGPHGNADYYRLKARSLHVDAMQEFIAATNETMFGLSLWAVTSPRIIGESIQLLTVSPAPSTTVRLGDVPLSIHQSATESPAVASQT